MSGMAILLTITSLETCKDIHVIDFVRSHPLLLVYVHESDIEVLNTVLKNAFSFHTGLICLLISRSFREV